MWIWLYNWIIVFVIVGKEFRGWRQEVLALCWHCTKSSHFNVAALIKEWAIAYLYQLRVQIAESNRRVQWNQDRFIMRFFWKSILSIMFFIIRWDISMEAHFICYHEWLFQTNFSGPMWSTRATWPRSAVPSTIWLSRSGRPGSSRPWVDWPKKEPSWLPGRPFRSSRQWRHQAGTRRSTTDTFFAENPRHCGKLEKTNFGEKNSLVLLQFKSDLTK